MNERKIFSNTINNDIEIKYLKNGWIKIPKLISKKQVNNLKKKFLIF